MSKAINKGQILEKSIIGVKNAWKEYYKASGGEWLWNAPEYYVTVKVFESLAKLGTLMVTLEDRVKDIIDYSNSYYPGRYSKGLRTNGKSDIIVGWNSGDPRGVIEVKVVRNGDLKPIKQDISRIAELLKLRDKSETSTLQFGIILAYTDYGDEQGKAKDKVKRRLENVKNTCYEECIKNSFHFYNEPYVKEVKDEESAWGVIGCMLSKVNSYSGTSS